MDIVEPMAIGGGKSRMRAIVALTAALLVACQGAQSSESVAPISSASQPYAWIPAVDVVVEACDIPNLPVERLGAIADALLVT